MTVSRPDPHRARRSPSVPALLWLLLAAGTLLPGCRTTGAPPQRPSEPDSVSAALVPESADYAAAAVAEAVLASRRGDAEVALVRLESIETIRAEDELAPTGLTPWARDAINAAAGDGRRYRGSTRVLLEDDDLDPALRARLERSVDDDPLVLAEMRMREARWASFASVFNTLAAPLSRAATASYVAGVGVVRALISLAVAQHEEEAISTQERQALAQWKRFVEENPESPEAAGIVERIEASQARWTRVQRDRAMRGARRALENDNPRVALVQAERALRYAPEDDEARGLIEVSGSELRRLRALQERVVEADPEAGARLGPQTGLALAHALLLRQGDARAEAEALREDPALGDEAAYAIALLDAEEGALADSWRALHRLADRDDEDSNMARHAQALVFSPDLNPYWAFDVARGHDRGLRARWILFGPLARGARDRDLPRAVEWLIELPNFLEVLGSLPNRLVAYPWLDPWPFGRSPAAYARRYLERYPGGPRTHEVRDWLRDYEERRGNWVGALALAEEAEASERTLARLRERAAEQVLAIANRERRPDVRGGLLREVAGTYPETEAADSAVEQLRALARDTTPQQIRISRGFLEENREVAGPRGLGLQRTLLDGELRNGELHPQGITLVGGRFIDFHFVPVSGNQEDEPETVRQKVSGERLARVVALVDETSLRNALVDRDEHYRLDADRERYFERARLGLTEEIDRRPTARSTFAYLGMRERYGLVRSRDSLLPIEFVIQGSLSSMSLGAFPRITPPRPTPDAPLFR